MKRLELEDILDVDAYALVRDGYRARIIAHKNQRRVSVGPRVSLAFEDRETLRYQIQEMTRIENTRDPEKVQIELDVYNELIPEAQQLSATLFIEIPDLEEIQQELDRLLGIDEHVALIVAGFEAQPTFARFDDRQMEADRISAVHYIRFTLPPEQVEAWQDGAEVRLRIDHAHYEYEAQLTAETRASLARDLADSPAVLLAPEEFQQARSARPDILLETPRVRARRIPTAGNVDRIVVEAVSASASFVDTEPEVLAELMQVGQQLARELRERSGGVRLQLDTLAGESGRLRLELTTLR